jgi:LuxR family maltose regulon positive regulatory protein
MSDKPANHNYELPSWLLKAKVRPLRSRIRLLERPRLLQRLDSGLECNLTLVHAPAGYGKSTLLSDWATQLQKHNIRCAWLSLDDEDNDQLQLLLYIIFAIAESGVRLDQNGFNIESLFKDSNPRSLLSRISHIIDEQGDELILILDDFERLSQDAVERVVLPLLKYAPVNLHIVIGTRDDSRLQIAALEARGLVNRLRADELRLSTEEQLGYLKKALSDEHTLSDDTLHAFCHLSEGWPVAVQLLRSALQQTDFNWQQQFSSDTTLTAYLSQQIFERLDADQQQFLLDLSIADRASIPLLNKIRQRDDAEMLLSSLQALHGLLQMPAGVQDVIRPHPLFREFLLNKLRREQSEHYRQLSLACAADCTERGDMLVAVKYCLSVDDEDAAVQAIVHSGGLILWVKEGIVRLRSALQLLQAETIERHPRISLISCLLLMKSGNVREAAAIFERVTGYAESLATDSKEKIVLEEELNLLDSMLAIYQGDQLSDKGCRKMLQRIEQAQSDAALLSHHYTLLCLSFLQRGELKRARQFAQQALPEFSRLESRYGEASMAFHLGEICFACGDGEEALALYQQAALSARQDFPDDISMRMVADTLLTEIEFEFDQLDGLWPRAKDLPHLVQAHEAWFDVYAACYTSVSQLAYLKEGLDAARLIIEEAKSYASTQGLRKLNGLLCSQEILLLLQARDLPAAQALSGSLPEITEADFSKRTWRERDCICKAHVQLAIAQKSADAALRLASDLADYAQANEQYLSEQQFRTLAARAAFETSTIDTAHKQLQRALSLCLKSGYKRIILDEDENIAALLDSFIDRPPAKTANELISYAKTLRHSIRNSSDGLLSKRELEILQQLRQGYANKLIARNIDISENTVRFHLKNIFSKLEVENRVQAIAVADKLSL